MFRNQRIANKASWPDWYRSSNSVIATQTQITDCKMSPRFAIYIFLYWHLQSRIKEGSTRGYASTSLKLRTHRILIQPCKSLKKSISDHSLFNVWINEKMLSLERKLLTFQMHTVLILSLVTAKDNISLQSFIDIFIIFYLYFHIVLFTNCK